MSQAMSAVCDACGTSNRPAAMFCIGCAGRLPGFVPSGRSALEAMAALPPRSDTAQRDGTARRDGLALPAEPLAVWFRLGVLGLAVMIGFTSWYLYIAREASSTSASTAIGTATAPASAPVVSSTSPAMRAPPALRASPPGPMLQPPRAPHAPRESTAENDDASLDASTTSRNGRSDAAVQAVASFYAALSAADGKSASAFVVPAKRGIGPFNDANMSRFYGSFEEPLRLRSIRKVDKNRVEARYSYRVSKTRCDGTALVETESVREQTLIRSIRANC